LSSRLATTDGAWYPCCSASDAEPNSQKAALRVVLRVVLVKLGELLGRHHILIATSSSTVLMLGRAAIDFMSLSK
jgi:hypothetical protein